MLLISFFVCVLFVQASEGISMTRHQAFTARVAASVAASGDGAKVVAGVEVADEVSTWPVWQRLYTELLLYYSIFILKGGLKGLKVLYKQLLYFYSILSTPSAKNLVLKSIY